MNLSKKELKLLFEVPGTGITESNFHKVLQDPEVITTITRAAKARYQSYADEEDIMDLIKYFTEEVSEIFHS